MNSSLDPALVDRLLTLGECDGVLARLREVRPGDGACLRVGPAGHRIRSESEGPEIWGPIHARRALGQLCAEPAIEPPLQLLNALVEIEHDWGAGRTARGLQQNRSVGDPRISDQLIRFRCDQLLDSSDLCPHE